MNIGTLDNILTKSPTYEPKQHCLEATTDHILKETSLDNKPSQIPCCQTENSDESFGLGIAANNKPQPNEEPRFQSKLGTNQPKPHYLKSVDFGGRSSISKNTYLKDPAAENLSSNEITLPSTKISSMHSSSGKDYLLTRNALTSSGPIAEQPSSSTDRRMNSENTERRAEGVGGDEIIITLRNPPVEPVYRTNLQSPRQEQNRNVPTANNGANPAAMLNSPASQTSNQSQIELSIAVNSENQQAEAAEPELNSRASPEREVKLTIRRAIFFFIGIAAGSLMFTFVINQGVSVQAILLVLYFYLAYIIFDHMVAIYDTRRELWRRKDDFFTALDGISGVIAVIFFHLKIIGLISSTVGACIPFGIMATIYCFTPLGAGAPKSQRFFLKVGYTIQALIAALKFDNVIDWDWSGVFMVLWCYLVIVLLRFLVYGVLLLILVLFGFTQIVRRNRQNNVAVNFFGLLWHFAYNGLGIIALTFFIGLTRLLKPEGDPSFAVNSAWAGTYLAFFLIFYTKIVSSPLTKFLVSCGTHTNANSSSINENKKDGIKFETEKKESYFMMLSPTYFLPLDLYTSMKNKERSSLNKLPESKQNLDKSSGISRKQLQEYKQALDQKFKFIRHENNLKTNCNERRSPTAALIQITKLCSEVQIKKEQGRKENLQEHETTDSGFKRNLSLGDLDNYPKAMYKPQGKLAEGENLCYICYDNPPDAILMNCGHGGICYDCAMQTLKKKNACMECRSKVEAIHRVDPNPKVANLIKAVEFSKVIEA